MFAQTDFATVSKLGNRYTDKDLLTAVAKADWCGYFYVNSRRKLIFDDGSVVELLRKNELNELNLDSNCFSNLESLDNAIYVIHSSGVILRTTSAAKFSKN
jgi:hypothetical protein